MKFKKTMLVAMVLLAVLTIGAVSADDTADFDDALAAGDSDEASLDACPDDEDASDDGGDTVAAAEDEKDISRGGDEIIGASENDVICDGNSTSGGNIIPIFDSNSTDSDAFEYWYEPHESVSMGEDEVLHVWLMDDSVNYGTLIFTVSKDDMTKSFSANVADGNEYVWKLNDLDLGDNLGMYNFTLTYNFRPVFQNLPFQLMYCNIEEYRDEKIFIDYPFDVIRIYESTNNIKLYVNDNQEPSEPGQRQSSVNWYPMAWNLQELGVNSPGTYNIRIMAYEDEELIETFEMALNVVGFDENEYRLITNYEGVHEFDRDAPVAYLYCPTDDGVSVYINEQLVGSQFSPDENHIIAWTLSDLGIDSNGDYELLVKDASGNVIDGAGLPVWCFNDGGNTINVGIWDENDERGTLYTDSEGWVVNVDVRDGSQGTIYVIVDEEVFSWDIQCEPGEDFPYHEWNLGDLNIAEAGEYAVTVKCNDDVIRQATLNVTQFNDDKFRLYINYENENLRLYCPDGSVGTVEVLIQKDDENGGTYPVKSITREVEPGDMFFYRDELEIENNELYYLTVSVTDGDNELYRYSQWFSFGERPEEPGVIDYHGTYMVDDADGLSLGYSEIVTYGDENWKRENHFSFMDCEGDKTIKVYVNDNGQWDFPEDNLRYTCSLDDLEEVDGRFILPVGVLNLSPGEHYVHVDYAGDWMEVIITLYAPQIAETDDNTLEINPVRTIVNDDDCFATIEKAVAGQDYVNVTIDGSDPFTLAISDLRHDERGYVIGSSKLNINDEGSHTLKVSYDGLEVEGTINPISNVEINVNVPMFGDSIVIGYGHDMDIIRIFLRDGDVKNLEGTIIVYLNDDADPALTVTDFDQLEYDADGNSYIIYHSQLGVTPQTKKITVAYNGGNEASVSKARNVNFTYMTPEYVFEFTDIEVRDCNDSNGVPVTIIFDGNPQSQAAVFNSKYVLYLNGTKIDRQYIVFYPKGEGSGDENIIIFDVNDPAADEYKNNDNYDSDVFNWLSVAYIHWVKDGCVNISLADLNIENEGTYNVTIKFTGADSGADELEIFSKNFKYGINDGAQMNVSAVDITYGETLIIIISSTENGPVDVEIANRNYTTTIKNGKAQVNVTGLDAGPYVIIAKLMGDGQQALVTNTTSVTVNKATPSVQLSDATINYGADARSTVTITADDEIGFEASVIEYAGAAVSVENNVITVSGLPAGSYTLSVTTAATANYNSTTKTARITVNKANPLVEVSNVEFYYGASGNAVVSITAIGEIALKTPVIVDHPEAIISLSGNVITVSGLKIGTYTLSLTTEANANYSSVTATSGVTVKRAVVTPENFQTFIDANGEVIQNLPELIFQGQFTGKTFNIKAPVALIGEGATFTDTRFKVSSDNVSISNMTVSYSGAESLITANGVSGLSLQNNNIVFSGLADNNYAIKVTDSAKVSIIDNNIQASGFKYLHGIAISADDFTIDGNMMMVNSTENACGINIYGPSSGVVENNDMTVKAKSTVYSINTNPSAGAVQVRYIRNTINSEAYFVVGIYDDSESIRDNVMTLSGNHTIGIVVLSKGADVVNNTINLNASNEGNDAEIHDDNVEVETSGIVVKNDAVITNNEIDSSMKAISAVEGASEISGNILKGDVDLLGNGISFTENTVKGQTKIDGSGIYAATNVIETDREAAVIIGPQATDVTVEENEAYSANGNGNDAIIDINGGNTIRNNKVNPALTITVANFEEGSASSIVVSANANFTGKVTVNITLKGAHVKTYTVEVSAGSGKTEIKGLSAGDYVATAVSVANDNFTEGHAVCNFTVTAKKTPVNPTPAPKKEDKIKLTLKAVKVKKSAKKLVLKATLKINGKAAKGKVLKFKFNGKTYKAKTNKKGIAKVTVKKKVLKKLKVGKKVKYQVTYSKTTVKKSAKVKK